MKYKINNKYVVDTKSPVSATKAVSLVRQVKKDSISEIAKKYNYKIVKDESNSNLNCICKLNSGRHNMTNAMKLQNALQAKGYNAKIITPDVYVYDSKCKDGAVYLVKSPYGVERIEGSEDTVVRKYKEKHPQVETDEITLQLIKQSEGWNTTSKLISENRDSKCKDNYSQMLEVRNLCIKNDYYTRGSISDYNKMLTGVNQGDWTIDEVAEDIAYHSKPDYGLFDKIRNQLKSIMKDSIKDAMLTYIDPSKKYAALVDGNWGYIYDGKTLKTLWSGKFTGGDPKKLMEEWKKANNLLDSIKDDDVEFLSKEEEQAIEDYKKAIANTKDPKLLNLYAHILREEIEHLEELENSDEEIVDSCKDENLNFDREAECDWCGRKGKVAVTHYGTSHYNRLVCPECAKELGINDSCKKKK